VLVPGKWDPAVFDLKGAKYVCFRANWRAFHSLLRRIKTWQDGDGAKSRRKENAVHWFDWVIMWFEKRRKECLNGVVV
jgi:hypothetical protein